MLDVIRRHGFDNDPESLDRFFDQSHRILIVPPIDDGQRFEQVRCRNPFDLGPGEGVEDVARRLLTERQGQERGRIDDHFGSPSSP